jgi:YggT family protein
VEILCYALQAFWIILIVRIILSWATMFWSPPSSLSPAIRVVYDLTEPVMGPVRRMLPPMGGFDFSPIVIFILIQVAMGAVCSA